MEQAAAHDRLIGAKVGNYEVKQKLGEGGMGAVYLAVHPKINKRVALKVLHPEFSSNQDVVGRFFNEAKAVNDIQHPNIVDIIDYGEMPSLTGGSQTVVYFIMEFLAGDSLAKVLIEQAPLAPERAQAIAIQVADALGASHRHGIVHRDLKPDNVMLSARRDGRDFVKVLDFGIAKLTSEGPGSRRTRTGIVMGTPAYMSPEQCEGRGAIDHRTDIYALGILLYEMLAGQVPFRGEGYGEVLVQHMTQAPQKPSTIRGVIPPHLEAVCMKALEKRPDNRFPSMDELMLALQDPVGHVEAHGGLDAFATKGLGGPPGSPYGISQPTPFPVLAHQAFTSPMPSPALGMGAVAQPTPPPGYTGSPIYPTPPPGTVTGGSSWRIAMVAAGAIALGVGAFVAYRSATGGDDEAVGVAVPAGDRGAPADPIGGQADPGVTGPVEPEPPRPDPPIGADDPILAASKVRIEVASNPTGAHVFVAGEAEPRGVTPYGFDLERGDTPIALVLRKDGFEAKRETIVPSQNRVMDLKLTAAEKQADTTGPDTTKVTPPGSDRAARERAERRRRERERKAAQERGSTSVGDNTMRPDL